MVHIYKCARQCGTHIQMCQARFWLQYLYCNAVITVVGGFGTDHKLVSGTLVSGTEH